MLKDILYLAIGGFATSLAEFIFNYNLVDLIKDKVLALLGRKG